MSAATITNAMTIDVEDYFQVYAMEEKVRREDWDRMPSRVERNVEVILGILEERRVRATFFVLGWVAERFPALVRRIVAGGHELASHGYAHRRALEQTRAEFTDDVSRAKAILEDRGGVAVRGYRAPSFSIGAGNLWALEVLAETGHRYSSSVYPVRHDLYGMPEAPRFPFHPPSAGGLLEIPVTTVRLFNRNFPAGGGGYFRLLPYGLARWCMRRVNDADHRPCIFYFHPWEIDPGQPRQAGLSLKSRFRHYVNLSTMERRIRALAADFRWGRMDEVFLGDGR